MSSPTHLPESKTPSRSFVTRGVHTMFCNVSGDFSIRDGTGTIYTPQEARAAWDKGQVHECSLAIKRLAQFGWDLLRLKDHYGVAPLDPTTVHAVKSFEEAVAEVKEAASEVKEAIAEQIAEQIAEVLAPSAKAKPAPAKAKGKPSVKAKGKAPAKAKGKPSVKAKARA